MASSQHLDLIIVVSGVPQPVRINGHEPLEHAVRKALQESGNDSRSSGDWELRTEQGQLLDQSARADSIGLHEGQTLFLNPRAGAGG
jgi:hypothetical protein